jgi:DNA-binding response OmpR family regulator
MEVLPATSASAPADPESPTAGQSQRRRYRVGDLLIDLLTYEVRQGDRSISLTPTEFQLLVTLAERAGEVIDYISLVQLALEYEAESWEAKELIKRHIFGLRQKIEPEPSSPRYILNVRGVGYRLVSPENLS